MKGRPVGVWIIGAIAAIAAIIELLAGLSALGVSGLGVSGILGIGDDVGGARAISAGVIMVVIAALYLFFALSFLGLKRWAWKALMAISIIAIVGVVLQFVFDKFYWSSIAGILIPLIVIVYLTRPAVKRAFIY